MKTTIYGLYKRGFVQENDVIQDDQRLTHCTDINEIYWFQGKYGYTGEDYFICEIEEDCGGFIQIEGTEQ